MQIRLIRFGNMEYENPIHYLLATACRSYLAVVGNIILQKIPRIPHPPNFSIDLFMACRQIISSKSKACCLYTAP